MAKTVTRRVAAAATALMVVALATSPALAQTAEGSDASNAPAQSPQSPAPDAESEDDDPTRLRFGGSFDFTVVATTTSAVGLGVGLALRAGVQFNHLWAIYYQPHGIVAGWVRAGSEGGIFALLNVAMVELTLPFIQFGFGPSWDVSHIEACNVTFTQCVNADGSNFGLDGRVAVILGGMGRGRRGAFSINLNVHSTFLGGDEAVISTSLGFGGEMY